MFWLRSALYRFQNLITLDHPRRVSAHRGVLPPNVEAHQSYCLSGISSWYCLWNLLLWCKAILNYFWFFVGWVVFQEKITFIFWPKRQLPVLPFLFFLFCSTWVSFLEKCVTGCHSYEFGLSLKAMAVSCIRLMTTSMLFKLLFGISRDQHIVLSAHNTLDSFERCFAATL